MSRFLASCARLSGILLLLAYACLRAWSSFASDEGIDAMREAREQHAGLLAQAQSGATVAGEPRPIFALAQPDTSTWSAKRIAAYQQSASAKSLPEAVLRIPRLKLAVPVYEGTDDATLNRGAGLIVGTASVHDRSGNVGIAAHRDGFFRPLKSISVGDTFFLDTVTTTREYRVTQLKIVDPADVGVLAPTSVAAITLVTCYPFYFVGTAPQRFIVRAQMSE